ncbi:MAG: dihydropteroate synthase [Acidimicrobiaceae bacterium]|nr:dihydropteroate synthase [Acidimicrobiaceae bacterium]
MTKSQLTIIGERINPGFKSTKELFEKEDLTGIGELAKRQASAGADYLNVNIGSRALTDKSFMKAVIEAIQEAVDLPLCFDFPNADVQAVCLETYDIQKALGRIPIVNSISETRWDMLELLAIRPFKVILMASERLENGVGRPNKFSTEVAQVAKRMTEKLISRHGLSADDIFVDVSISALSSDTEGLLQMAIEGIKAISGDPMMSGVHLSGGLSNIVQQLPPKAADGSDLKSQIERAFLTLAMPYGFDTVLGTPWKEYEPLPPDSLILSQFEEIISARGVDAMRLVRKLYRG